MSTYSIDDISKTVDRFKLYILKCEVNEMQEKIAFLESQNIHVINIGKELAKFIEGLTSYNFLYMDVYEYVKALLNKNKAKIEGSGNDALAIYNLGILLEPALGLNAVQLVKEFSKSSSLIILWENQSEISDRLDWLTQKNNYCLDFSESPLKKLHHAI